MNTDIRDYTVGFSVNGTVTIIPYTIIDGDKIEQPPIILVEGDSYEVSYKKKVVFEDTIDVGNRQWSLKRELNRWRGR